MIHYGVSLSEKKLEDGKNDMTHKLTNGFIKGFKTQCEPAGMNDKYRNIDGIRYESQIHITK
jgi:hypothetical protein